MASDLSALPTPSLLLSLPRFDRNIARMNTALAAKGVRLRPHIKTVKSKEAYARASGVGVCVSTLREAEYAFAHGARDILYAVGIAPNRLERAMALIAAGADLTLAVDSLEAAAAVAEAAGAKNLVAPVVVEIDADDHRAGVKPRSGQALEIAKFLEARPGSSFRGLMTHAGASYDTPGAAAIRAMAERERRAVVETAAMLSEAGISSKIVSAGSTPTALFGESAEGLTELRAGVFMTMDLVMAGLGVCAVDDVALSVLASVIGLQPERGQILIDAGWMALSRDRGTEGQAIDYGYGAVCDLAGVPIADYCVVGANQEHGIVARRGGGPVDFSRFAIGTLVRVLPNHACATAAQHDRYDVVDQGDRVVAEWPRFGGW
ncbi:MAG: alanine racemase [Parvularculaceae bacterium]|nr:alanine racemase [Parvularculaceae bacterium]